MPDRCRSLWLDVLTEAELRELSEQVQYGRVPIPFVVERSKEVLRMEDWQRETLDRARDEKITVFDNRGLGKMTCPVVIVEVERSKEVVHIDD